MPIEKPSAKPSALEIQVCRTIREHAMLAPGEHVVVAVSGGADSTALLLCLHDLAPELHFSLTVAHLNHRIRGSEGDGDEDFVRRMSADLGLPFVSEIIEVKRQAAATKQNLEQLARQRRFDFLNRTARRVGAQKIAIGHNQNDQAETALFRFIRGSGIEGLSSIHPVVGGLVIRPLLECSRKSIIEFLRQRGARYREDSTNMDIRHSRNRIRRELVPYLEESFNPRLVQTIAREAALARETWALLESQAGRAFESLHHIVDNGIALKMEEVLKLHPAMQKQVLRYALRQCLGSLCGITTHHIESLLSLCSSAQSGNRLRMPHKSMAIRQFDDLLLLRHEPAPIPTFCHELSVPGKCLISETGATLSATLCNAPLKSISENRPNYALLEPATLPEFLVVRSRMPGDRYGGTGHRKVKKMLIDNKIPLSQRSILPMVANGKDVIWIPGFKPARAYQAHPGSEAVVMLELGLSIPETRAAGRPPLLADAFRDDMDINMEKKILPALRTYVDLHIWRVCWSLFNLLNLASCVPHIIF